MCQIYEGRLQILGIGKEIYKIRFKEHVLCYFPNAQEQNDGKRAILVFEQGMQQMLKTSQQHNRHTDNALILMKAARIVRAKFFHIMGLILTLHFTRDASSSLCLPVSRY